MSDVNSTEHEVASTVLLTVQSVIVIFDHSTVLLTVQVVIVILDHGTRQEE